MNPRTLFALLGLNVAIALLLGALLAIPISNESWWGENLPTTNNPSRFLRQGQRFDVFVKPSGVCLVGANVLPCNEIGPLLNEAVRRGGLRDVRQILLHGDKQARYEEVRAVLEQLNSAGFRDVVLLADMKPPSS